MRLEAIDATEAAELITESWRCRAAASLVRAFDESVNLLGATQDEDGSAAGLSG